MAANKLPVTMPDDSPFPIGAGSRLLIVSHDVVDRRMAGPGIRYWELANVLAQHFPVILAVPGRTELRADGFGIRVYQPHDWETLRVVAEHADVVLPCGGTLVDFPALARPDRPIIIDGYDPAAVETLALFASEPLDRQTTYQQDALALLRLQCQLGDFFVCASERQRDWWLGLLEGHGRVNPHTYAVDPSLRQLVDVVPFGLPARPPQHTRPVLKGVVPEISPDDRVVLWGGGIWEWLDPLTLIKALATVCQQRSDVRLVFPGTRHPNTAAVPDMVMRKRTVELAEDLGLLNRFVFFGDWVEYSEWPNYLIEADVGVSLHHDTLEAHLAFRTRVLDYFWAGLPMIVTDGDAASGFVAQYRLGSVVSFGDVAGVATALLELLEIDRDDWQPRFDAVRADLSWERVAQPLVEFCRSPRQAADRNANQESAWATDSQHDRLADQMQGQETELMHLRDLVHRYERGYFIRTMRRLAAMRRALFGNRFVGRWLEPVQTEWFYQRLRREVGRASSHAFVDRAYWRILGRGPDLKGFQNLTDQLLHDQRSRRQVVADMVRSDERRGRPRPKWGVGEALHRARCLVVSQLPDADHVLDLGGAAHNSIQGALFLMGYPHRVRSMTIVDLPPAERLGHYGSGDHENAAGWIESEMGPIRYLHTSMTDLSAVENKSIDLVFSGQSIEHVSEEDGLRVMREVYRVLRPGGCFWLDTPNGAITRIQSPDKLLHPEHKVEYHVSEMASRLREVGFVIRKTGGIGPMPHTVRTGVFDVDELVKNARISDKAEICYLFFVECVRPG